LPRLANLLSDPLWLHIAVARIPWKLHRLPRHAVQAICQHSGNDTVHPFLLLPTMLSPRVPLPYFSPLPWFVSSINHCPLESPHTGRQCVSRFASSTAGSLLTTTFFGHLLAESPCFYAVTELSPSCPSNKPCLPPLSATVPSNDAFRTTELGILCCLAHMVISSRRYLTAHPYVSKFNYMLVCRLNLRRFWAKRHRNTAFNFPQYRSVYDNASLMR
jgi:hypothetical protein